MKLHIREMLDAQGEHLSFHTPGHKRAGDDITELSYSDVLLSPKGVIAAAEADAAQLLGADKSYFLTDGSTCGIFSMLYALRLRGISSLAAPSSVHRSVKNACRVLGLRQIVIPAEEELFPRQPAPVAIEEALDGAEALLLTSPDYYGFFAPLEEARTLCDRMGKPFLIDGAHGSHLHGRKMHAGQFADMWVDGVHKSLPALTQGAVVSAKGDWTEPLREGVRTFRTTSPSYPIMASIEYALKYPIDPALEEAAQEAKRRLGALANEDWTKILVPFGDRGREVSRLLEEEGVWAEFDDGNFLMFYLSPCTKREDLDRLVSLLEGQARGKMCGRGTIPIYSEE